MYQEWFISYDKCTIQILIRETVGWRENGYIETLCNKCPIFYKHKTALEIKYNTLLKMKAQELLKYAIKTVCYSDWWVKTWGRTQSFATCLLPHALSQWSGAGKQHCLNFLFGILVLPTGAGIAVEGVSLFTQPFTAKITFRIRITM